jgi:hypothetical protein
MRDGRLEVLRPRAVQATGGRLIFDVATSGLLPGDRIVVSQIASPRPGMAVAEAGQPGQPPAARVAAESEGDAS